MTQLEPCATESPSLADVMLWLLEQDQTTWLRLYDAKELCSLFFSFRTNVFVVCDGVHIAGAAIAAPTERVDEVRIPFICAPNPTATKRFVALLRKKFPAATHITFNRRGKEYKTPIRRLKG